MKQCYIIPALLNKAHLLSLSASEMTVLIGDLKVLGSNFVDSNRVVLINSIGVLNNDFFVNLLDMSFKWDPLDDTTQKFKGIERESGLIKCFSSRLNF